LEVRRLADVVLPQDLRDRNPAFALLQDVDNLVLGEARLSHGHHLLGPGRSTAFASWLTMKGRPLKEVSELLRHSSVKMTERYAHLAPERLRGAVAALEDFNTTSAQAPAPTMPQPVTVG
jgi:hypothetical protein